MEAPENIWLSPNEYRSNEPSCFWSESQRTDYDIAYIRKDTFVEKVCEFISRRVFNCAEGSIIEDFKNYMKGE